MSDLIRIVDLEVFSHIGVADEERRDAQRLLISLEMAVDSLAEAAKTDDLAKTVNYFAVAQRIRLVSAQRPRKLIETLAEEIAAEIRAAFSVKKIALEIKKFILPDAQHVSVKIERGV